MGNAAYAQARLPQTIERHPVYFVEYWEHNAKTGKIQHFSWITDLDITEENVYQFTRGARARWKIEKAINQGTVCLRGVGLTSRMTRTVVPAFDLS